MIHDLIYDWNPCVADEARPRVQLNDETLRDGLQSPSVRQPTLDDKIALIHLMDALGIEAVDLGLPAMGPKAQHEIEVLAREITTSRLKISPNVAVRTHIKDIQPVLDIVQRVGTSIEVGMFVGISPLRRFVEGWDMATLATETEALVKLVVANGLPATVVTEDTTRCDPDSLMTLYGGALRAGATAFTLCDTVGHATPAGAQALVKFVIEKIVRPSGKSIRIDWHGHNDRGLAVATSLAAISAGANRIHACANSLGERCGNTSMEQMLVNLKLLGLVDRPLTRLKEYSDLFARSTGVSISSNTPVVGSDAFRTTTGVHAAAILKAYRRGNTELANIVYSGVPSHYFGIEQLIEIGPMSGRSNIEHWLERNGITGSPELFARISAAARAADHTLTNEELHAIVARSEP